MLIQKDFKVTPDYLEIGKDTDGFYMGVYLCIGYNIHHQKHFNALKFQDVYHEVTKLDNNTLSKPLDCIKMYLQKNNKIFLFLGDGKHKIKRKAEKTACETAISWLLE